MKTVLIIGGNRGLGKEVATTLSNKYEIKTVGSKELNVKDFNKCQDFFEKNKFDIVINFAGTNYDTLIHKVNNDNIENVNDVIDVNIKGGINIVSSCLGYMRNQKYGRVILISSILSEIDVIGTSIYSSSKAFLDKFVKNVSKENIKYGITSNTIQLGYFDGGMTYRIPIKNIDKIKENIGLNRFGSISELSKTIEFLIDNEYVTGTNIKISGGI